MFCLPRSERERRQRSLCALASLVIIFVLPLPWGHTHCALADTPAAVYQSHLLLYHCDSSGADAADHDWHLHWKIAGLEGCECLRCQSEVVAQPMSTLSPPQPMAELPALYRSASDGAEVAIVGRWAAAPLAPSGGASLLHRLCVLRL